MPTDRRNASRVSKWFDANWLGASGDNSCRVSDLSLSGCFVNSRAYPKPGDRTTIIVLGDSGELALEADVVYVSPAIGFGVRFTQLSDHQRAGIEQLIRSAAKASA